MREGLGAWLAGLAAFIPSPATAPHPIAPAPILHPSADCVFMAAPRNETAGLQLAVVSLTQQAGEALQALLAEHPGAGELSVQLRMPPEGSVDWSSLLLWLIATGTVTAGALWAGHGHWAGLSGREPGGSPAKRAGAGDVPSVTIGPKAAAGFVVLASGMLLLLFFFLDAWVATLLVRGGRGAGCGWAAGAAVGGPPALDAPASCAAQLQCGCACCPGGPACQPRSPTQ